MEQEPLYRRIHEDGKHPAMSKRNPGAISGAALDDETNKPSGSSDFMPVEGLTEEELKNLERQYVFWGGIATRILDWGHQRFMRWWTEDFLPTNIPKAKSALKKLEENAREKALDFIFDGKRVKEQTVSKNELPTFQLPLAGLDFAYEQYEKNMTSEEASRELLEAYVLLIISIKKFQNVATSNISDEYGNRILFDDIIKRLNNPDVLSIINNLFLTEPNLVNEWQGRELSKFLGRSLVEDAEFIPIGEHEIKEEMFLA